MAWRKRIILTAAAATAFAFAGAGCQSQPSSNDTVYTRDQLAASENDRGYGDAREREIRAVYRGGVMQASLPETLRPEALLAAARQTLVHRGYTITEDSSTAGLGRVMGEAPPGSRDWNWPRWVKISAGQTSSGSRIDVAISPRDETLSAAILDETLRRLGR